MKATITSIVLLVIMLIAIAANAVYINSLANDLLNIVYSLPSDMNASLVTDENEIEKVKAEINRLCLKWSNNEYRTSMTTPYVDIEKIKTSVSNIKEYFFNNRYPDYFAARKSLIAALERFKQNEVPKLENIF